MKSIESQVIKVREILEEQHQNNEQVLRLEDANEMFEHLVSRGVIQKRGYNLVGADNVNAYRFQFKVQS
jgi:hypothetical protein